LVDELEEQLPNAKEDMALLIEETIERIKRARKQSESNPPAE